MENHNENIRELTLRIKDKIGKPINNYAVLATIESFGIRNKDSESDFGVPSLMYLTDLIFNDLLYSEEHLNAKNIKQRSLKTNRNDAIRVSDYVWVKVKIFAHYYPLGIFHLLPVFFQIGAIILFGYSLWTYLGFNPVQSTAVVMGVILGLVLTAGFVQVIGRQASFYWNHEDFSMIKKSIDYIIKTGIRTFLLFFSVLFGINVFLPFYPFQVLVIVFIYSFLIGLLLLYLAPLHTIKQRWMIIISVFIGTATALILKTKTDLEVYFTHWIGIGLSILVAFIYLKIYFYQKLRNTKTNFNLDVNPSVFIYHNYHYFGYGFFMYLFLFLDRILAWTATNKEPLPFLFFFEKNYELGMDFAILVFLLLSGVLEYAIASFSRFLDIGQKNTTFLNQNGFNKQLSKMYWQHILLFIITTIAIFYLIYLLIYSPWGYHDHFSEYLDEISIMVAAVGGLGYFFLTWGMLNTLYLFTLGQPSTPFKAIVISLICNGGIGFLFSRFIAPEYSVFGMLFGSILFMAITLKATISFINQLDYYYYAAY